ncbi:thioredoxin peroxidase [Candidatus Marinamargulisbacteria bacterium SCGC AG-410-N11]|nr:thioredoxin peroxidase [Candidatus Marinamargulisbacteria bacterium SCGC AG-410-N11]
MSVLVGKPAPQFDVKAVVNGGEVVDSFKLSDLKGKYVVLFFYPLDFTFVCPTELHAFQEKLAEFEKRNTQVVACSVDSWFSHVAWLKTDKLSGGISGITYPIISDFNKEIAKQYDVLQEELGASYRGLFLIDQEGIVRHQVVNDLPLGRNIDEAIRMVDSLQFYEANGEVCPANWTQGKTAITPNEEGIKSFFKKES